MIILGIDPIVPPDNSSKEAEITKLEGEVGVIDTETDARRVILIDLEASIIAKEDELDASTKYLHILKTEDRKITVQQEILTITTVLEQLRMDVTQTKSG